MPLFQVVLMVLLLEVTCSGSANVETCSEQRTLDASALLQGHVGIHQVESEWDEQKTHGPFGKRGKVVKKLKRGKKKLIKSIKKGATKAGTSMHINPECEKRTKDYNKTHLGHRLCEYCKNHRHGSKNNWNKCFGSHMWNDDTVTLDQCRRRASNTGVFKGNFKAGFKMTCVHPSKQEGRSAGIVFGNSQTHSEAKDKMCGCVRSFLEKCDDGDCMQEVICACNGVCSGFKKQMGCRKGSLSQYNQSGQTSMAQRRGHEGISQELDHAVTGKCTAETQ